jgi:hypothetical protein
MAYNNEELQNALLDLQMQQLEPTPVKAKDTMTEDALAGDISKRKGYLEDMREKLSKMYGQGQGNDFSNMDLKPFLAFGDSMAGTNSAAQYTPIDKRLNMANHLQNTIDKEDQKLSQNQLDYLKMKSTEATKFDANDLRAQILAASMGFHGRVADQRDEVIHNRNLNAMDNDKNLQQLVTSAQNLQTAVNNFQQGGASAQEFHELQQAVRSNLGIKGAGGVGEREATYLHSLGMNAAGIKQFISGNVEDVRNYSPEMVNQVIGLANMELNNKKTFAKAQIEQKKAGHQTFYKGNQSRGSDYNNAADLKIKQLDQISTNNSGPQKGEVIDGHVFQGGDPADANNWKAQ